MLTNGINGLIGINKLSKNIRKSCNDLYSMTRNMKRQKSTATMLPSDGSHSNDNSSEGKENQENQHANSNHSKSNDNSEDTSKNSKYSKRLQRLKARLIKTTANMFTKKRKDAPNDSPDSSEQQVTEECAMSHSRHASMPNLSKIELDENKIQFIDKNDDDSDDNDDDEGSYCEIDLERPSMIRQQSFINSVKSKLKKRKNGLSKKNLHSTVINPALHELESTTVSRAKQTKRTKFF